MQGERGANSPSNQLADYISLNSTNDEEQNESMWNVGEPSSSSGPNQVGLSHIEPGPDRGWPSLMKPCSEPPSSVLSLGDHGSSSSSFSDPFGQSSDPFELDDRRVSRKRKAVELSIGQSSSGVGSSNMFQRPEGSLSSWDTVAENPPLDPIIPRLGLSVGRVSSENPNRNVNLRISSSSQQDPLPANNDNNNNNRLDIPDPYSSLRLNPIDFGSPPVAATPENSSNHLGQPVIRVPALRRNLQSTSRWTRNSIAIANRTANLDSLSDHLFAPPSNIRNGVQSELNGTVNNSGPASSRAGPMSGPAPHHHHPRRLSAFLRRSLLSATELEANGGPNSNIIPRIPPVLSTSSSSSQDTGIPPVVSIQGHHHQPHSRSSLLLGRQLEGGSGFPYLSQTGGSEGRGRLVSEIRNVLDLMRRGQPLRFEDLMLLDQSVFYGIADIHDRHRDMRLDIDNMSYEELLALEERIGNVNTGLTEETISKHLKHKQYVAETGQPDTEPCCICQDEYKDGDDLGTLECGHHFHRGCIKQWLQHKNSCPICKSTGFKAT